MPIPVTSEPLQSTETWSLQTIVPHDESGSTAEFPPGQETPASGTGGTGQSSELQKPSSHSHSIPPPDHENIPVTRVVDEQADGDASSESVPPDNAAEDMRPTRRYQAVLLFAGFMMIFQVIGINQTYGIFQVGGTCHGA